MSKRPETPDDLPSWDRYETLATFVLTNEAIRCGLLPAIDAVVKAYCARNDSMIRVENSYGGSLEITQFRAPDVVAARLREAQAKWDEEHPPPPAPVAPAKEPMVSNPDMFEPSRNDVAVPEPIIDRHDTAAERCGEDDGTGSACNEPIERGQCPQHGEVGPPLPPADPYTMAVFGGLVGHVPHADDQPQR